MGALRPFATPLQWPLPASPNRNLPWLCELRCVAVPALPRRANLSKGRLGPCGGLLWRQTAKGTDGHERGPA